MKGDGSGKGEFRALGSRFSARKDEIRLRIVKRSDTYACSYSVDDHRWTSMRPVKWLAEGFRVGIAAFNCDGSSERPADFDYVRLVPAQPRD